MDRTTTLLKHFFGSSSHVTLWSAEMLIEERGQRQHAVANAQVRKEHRDDGVADHKLVAPMLQSKMC